jgi:hypothetical protein
MRRVQGVLALDEEIDDETLDVLNQPPSEYPRYSEHPDEVEASTNVALGKLDGAGVYETVTVKFAEDNLMKVTARWERRWVWNKDTQEWEVKSRYVAREFKAMDPYRDDLFVPGAAHSTGRVIDYIGVKEELVTVEIDAVDAYYNAEETEAVYVPAPIEFIEARRAAGLSTDVAWRLRKQLTGRRAACSNWNDHVLGLLLGRGFLRCPDAPQFYVRDEPRTVVEVHVDDGHLAASRETALAFVEDLRTSIKLKGGDVNEYYVRYSHLEARRRMDPKRREAVPE